MLSSAAQRILGPPGSPNECGAQNKTLDMRLSQLCRTLVRSRETEDELDTRKTEWQRTIKQLVSDFAGLAPCAILDQEEG
jgi:hypothetical protein